MSLPDLFLTEVKPKKRARAKKKRGAEIAQEWMPSNSDREYGHKLLLTDFQIDDMAEDMRLWSGANANREVARKSNWSLAFKGWMRREAKKVITQNGTNKSAIAAIGRLRESGLRLTPKPGSLPIGQGGNDPRLLPKG